MGKTKKINVKVIFSFFDKKENIRRNVGDTFELTAKRLEEINKFESDNNIKLVEVVDEAAGTSDKE